MSEQFVALSEELSALQTIALAHAPRRLRTRSAALFAFDRRLGALVAQAREPILGQMRLAWWRERLSEAAHTRPAGYVVLDALGEHWAGSEIALIPLADAFEALLVDDDDPAAAFGRLAVARGTAWKALADGAGRAATDRGLERAAALWTYGEMLGRLTSPEDRQAVMNLAAPLLRKAPPLPRDVRHLAILSGIARRSLRRAEPLEPNRGTIATAWRIALTGR